jgi:hypothetical protein
MQSVHVLMSPRDAMAVLWSESGGLYLDPECTALAQRIALWVTEDDAQACVNEIDRLLDWAPASAND